MHYEFVDDHVIAPEWYGAYGHPLKAFEWLRHNDPVRYVRPEGFQPFWAIIADLVFIKPEPRLFLNHYNTTPHKGPIHNNGDQP